MALFISTHAEIALLHKLELLNWKLGPDWSTHCHPSGSSYCRAEGRQVPPLLCSFQFQLCHWVRWDPTSCLPLEITFQKTCVCTLSLQAKVKKHSYLDPHRKHILFPFKTLPGQCSFNSKHTSGNIPRSKGLLSAFGSEIYLGELRGACKFWCPCFEIYKLWLPSPQW